jgi:hypothetical protein
VGGWEIPWSEKKFLVGCYSSTFFGQRIKDSCVLQKNFLGLLKGIFEPFYLYVKEVSAVSLGRITEK